MSSTINTCKDHKDATSALLSLSSGAAVPSNTDAPTSNDPASDGDTTSKETKPQEPKPESSPKTVPEEAPEKKEETTTLAGATEEDNAKESLSELAARHLEEANAVTIAEESVVFPEVEPSSAAPGPPKGWDREFESILDESGLSKAMAKGDEEDTSSEKPAPDKSNQEEKADETNGAGKETKEEAAPGEKRRVCSKSVGSARGSQRRKKVSAKSTLKGATLTGTWTAAEANEKKRKASEPKKPALTKKKKVKKSSASPAAVAAPRVGPTEVYSGPPEATDKLADGDAWPAGWTKKKFQRRSGAARGRPDPYWYSPVENKKLRSMNEVNRFMNALKKTNGDELKAWEIFKKK